MVSNISLPVGWSEARPIMELGPDGIWTVPVSNSGYKIGILISYARVIVHCYKSEEKSIFWIFSFGS